MSYEIKERVVGVAHVQGCSKNRYCGPECARVTDGWLLDLILKVPHRRDFWRRRERIPLEWSGSSAKRNAWASQREGHFMKRLLAKEEKQSIITVRELVDQFGIQRKGEGSDYDKEMQRFRDHVLPVLGTLKVVDVRPRHAHELVMALRRTESRRGGVLAPRTIRQIYFSTKQLFQYALLQELIPGNPILVGKGVLPKKADKDPGWRKGAVFTISEVELLISSDKVPLHRRVVYAISFLTGLRPGQVFELRWGDYEADFEPMGRLSSSRSWNSVKKTVKSTKTNVDHLVPVHAVLAKILAAWKLHGWPARHGRQPKQADLIVPTINGTQRDSRRSYMDFMEDLDALGLRRRRQYDSRRTFASLALNGGASKDAVRSITHPRPADVFDLYVTMSWEALCGAVKAIRVELKEGNVVAMPRPKLAALGSPLAGDKKEAGH